MRVSDAAHAQEFSSQAVKYRKPKVQATMARLDAEYAELKKAASNPDATPEEKSAATAKLEAREKHLAPSYQSVALEFADLHDRSGRMKAKADCTPCDWENSRRAIYWSIRRSLSELVSERKRSHTGSEADGQRIMKKLAGANPNLSYEERKAIFAEYALADSTDDAAVASHLEKSGDVLENLVQQVRDEYCAEGISSWL